MKKPQTPEKKIKTEKFNKAMAYRQKLLDQKMYRQPQKESGSRRDENKI